MSLDVYLMETKPTEVYSANITHNLGKMAKEAGIYQHLWRPEELGITKASELIKPLTEGYQRLVNDPDKFKQYDSPNGWGMYEHFLPFVKQYIDACVTNPYAEVKASR
jgi:hypothetical protein